MWFVQPTEVTMYMNQFNILHYKTILIKFIMMNLNHGLGLISGGFVLRMPWRNSLMLYHGSATVLPESGDILAKLAMVPLGLVTIDPVAQHEVSQREWTIRNVIALQSRNVTLSFDCRLKY